MKERGCYGEKTREGKSMPYTLEICDSGSLDMDGTPSVWTRHEHHQVEIKRNFVLSNIASNRYIRLEIVEQKLGLERNLEEASWRGFNC